MVHIVGSKSEFDESLKKNKLVVVDFFAEWCGPCKFIAPKIDDLSKKHTDVTFLKVDVDAVADVSEAHKIEAMPTFILFKEGKEVKRVVGADINAITKAVEELKK